MFDTVDHQMIRHFSVFFSNDLVLPTLLLPGLTLTYQVAHILSIYRLTYPTQLQFTVVFLKVPLSAQRS